LTRSGSTPVVMTGGILTVNDTINVHTGPIGMAGSGSVIMAKVNGSISGDITVSGFNSIMVDSPYVLRIGNVAGSGRLTYARGTNQGSLIQSGSLTFSGDFTQDTQATL